jgi:transposase
VIVWHVLHDQVAYAELGADYYTERNDPGLQKARLVHQLKELGFEVEISPAA